MTKRVQFQQREDNITIDIDEKGTSIIKRVLSQLPMPRGGGGNLVLFIVRGRAIFRGTFFKPLRNYGYHFHKFLTFHRIMGVLFEGFFIISRIKAHIIIRFAEL